MAISHTISLEGDTLVVVASGFDESLEDAKAYGMAIIQAGLEAGVTRIFCDEVALEYRLGTLDTYLLGKYLAEVAPRLARVAIVCQANQFSDARFWEDVAVNRGLTVRAFTDREKAREWLAKRPSG